MVTNQIFSVELREKGIDLKKAQKLTQGNISKIVLLVCPPAMLGNQELNNDRHISIVPTGNQKSPLVIKVFQGLNQIRGTKEIIIIPTIGMFWKMNAKIAFTVFVGRPL
jgi:hypothetical protein